MYAKEMEEVFHGIASRKAKIIPGLFETTIDQTITVSDVVKFFKTAGIICDEAPPKLDPPAEPEPEQAEAEGEAGEGEEAKEEAPPAEAPEAEGEQAEGEG